jgi:hypothetical protein
VGLKASAGSMLRGHSAAAFVAVVPGEAAESPRAERRRVNAEGFQQLLQIDHSMDSSKRHLRLPVSTVRPG